MGNLMAGQCPGNDADSDDSVDSVDSSDDSFEGCGPVFENANFGSYEDPNSIHVHELQNLCPNTEYKITVKDGYGDGVCCSYGQGYVHVFSGGEKVVDIADFGREVTEFWTTSV